MNKLLYVAIGVALAVGGYAFADYQRKSAADAEWADVLSVRPVTETITTPRQECRAETVTRYEKETGNTKTGTIVGALVGGALGNQVGGGSGRKAATVAGAVAGGFVGHEIDQRNNPPRAVQTTEQRCRTVNDVSEKVVAYDVEYRWQGEVRRARMDHDPGDRFRVEQKVVIEPARG